MFIVLQVPVPTDREVNANSTQIFTPIIIGKGERNIHVHVFCTCRVKYNSKNVLLKNSMWTVWHSNILSKFQKTACIFSKLNILSAYFIGYYSPPVLQNQAVYVIWHCTGHKSNKLDDSCTQTEYFLLLSYFTCTHSNSVLRPFTESTNILNSLRIEACFVFPIF